MLLKRSLKSFGTKVSTLILNVWDWKTTSNKSRLFLAFLTSAWITQPVSWGKHHPLLVKMSQTSLIQLVPNIMLLQLCHEYMSLVLMCAIILHVSFFVLVGVFGLFLLGLILVSFLCSRNISIFYIKLVRSCICSQTASIVYLYRFRFCS